MAHVSQEFAFRTTGSFGGRFRSTEGLVFALAVGNVDKADDFADDPVVAADRMGPDFDRKTGTIGAPENFVQFVIVAASPSEGMH